MSNKDKIPFDGLDWSDFQKKYIDALNAFNSPKPTVNSGWVNAMNDWWQFNKPETPNENMNMFENVLEQSRNFYYVSEQFTNLVDGINKLKNNNKGITDFINSKFKDIDPSVFGGNNSFNWNTLADNFEQPIELLKKTFTDSSVFSNTMFNESNPGMGKIAEQLFSAAGLGANRETQDKHKLAIKLWAKYQDNYQEDLAVKARLNKDALELMRTRILEMSAKGEDISSMRQVYDLWIDSNEKIYGEYVFTEEYSELNSRLVNSMMAFKKQSNEITEDALVSMNMPTTSSVNELARRHYELRKQVKAMQQEISNLKKELLLKNNKPVAAKNDSKSSIIKRKSKTKTNKRVAPKSSNVVQIKQDKKKLTNNVKAIKKKTKQKTKKTATDKGMIEIKF